MVQPYLGEIRWVGFNFAPRGWMLCAGQLLSIAQNTALFSILGTTYGGNGQTNFALPNLQGQAMVNAGQGPGLTDYALGEQTGTPSVTLLTTEIPSHNHAADTKILTGSNASTVASPQVGFWLTRLATTAGGAVGWNTPPRNNPVLMHPLMVGVTGGSQPHNNMQPYLALLPCIAVEGIFPSRN
ncbi:tail fiber protein [Sphingomonas sp.]|uniref:phage tail protein n=1 Tax=Sphingomonas sp. TaxID=28214 RepID=UPI001B019BEA|nr:tail fiber protein [Sphingomonas sp.]MBO9715033.1 phage tail protein [Sphingomonas sp.]